MKIYTKTGDDGTTGLFGGTRVTKDSVRIEVYGTVDELNSIIGLSLSHGVPEPVRSDLLALSSLLFSLGADLATPLYPEPKYPIPRIQQQHIAMLESHIDTYEEHLTELKSFILPGGTAAASFLHNARTVCRRAERRSVELAQQEDIGEFATKFLNRLSDYLFTAARYTNHLDGVQDIPWTNPEI